MKVTNWRRKLAASLVAGGLMTPCAAFAADLNTNLVNNPSFEEVGATTCCYSATEILGWTDGTQLGFAYDIRNGQGYDTGGPLAGGGNYYFTSNSEGVDVPDVVELDVSQPGQVSQDINVTNGGAANQIAMGEAVVKLSAFFTTYTNNGVNDGDLGNLHVEFLNAGGFSLGSTKITAKDTSTWNQVTGADFIPVGTTQLKASIYGTPMTGGPDGYIDLVNVQVSEAVNELLYLEVNTVTGQVAIKNQTGDPFHVDYYEIKASGPAGDYSGNGVVDAADYTVWRDNLNTSVTLPNDSTPGTVDASDYAVWKANFGDAPTSLDVADWNSLQEQNLAGFPGGNGTGNGWEQAGGSDGGILSESFLTGNSNVANSASIGLGAAFNPGSPHDLEFRYAVVPDAGGGTFTGTGALVRGFVRYVGGAGAASAVPEPSSVLLVGLGLATLAVGRRRTDRDQS